ncbi:MAG: beta-galactosidase [Armatimonadia bacterium]
MRSKAAAPRLAVLLFPLVFLLTSTCGFAQERPVNLLRNGGYEHSGGWSLGAAAKVVPSDRGDKALLITDAGAANQDVLLGPATRTVSCAVDLRTEDVKPDGTGYAYAAAYQLSETGELVAYKDFAQAVGTRPWQRHTVTVPVAPGATILSLRCGLFNASGKVWLDNWTVVEGERALRPEEVVDPESAPRVDNTVAILREPQMPVRGAGSSPERLARLFEGAGFKVRFLTAEQMADPRQLSTSLNSLVILPYGQSFPAIARNSFTAFLRQGGSFISLGGYALNYLLMERDGRWLEEKEVLAQLREAALTHSVLPDGGFEATQNAPIAGTVLDGKWHRDGTICTVTSEEPREGRSCARVEVAADSPREDRWYLDLKPRPGARYVVSGWVRTRDVVPIGNGFAYLALYEYGAKDELGPWKDFAQVTGTHEWQQFQYEYTPSAQTVRLHIKAGLYRATGTAWFDDIRLAEVTGSVARPMNTATGSPGDGLGVSPTQIGVFDASYPLRRVASARPAAGQFILRTEGSLASPLSGWVASGVQGSDNARWIPLVSTYDRFGRERGPLGSLMINYGGYFAGSMWGYFGVENEDLFDGRYPWLDASLVDLTRFVCRGAFLRSFTTDQAAYRDGEPVNLSVVAVSQGVQSRRGQVVVEALPAGKEDQAQAVGTVPFELSPGETRTCQVTWNPGTFAADLYQVRARLEIDGRPVDQMVSGFAALKPQTLAQGPGLRFSDNYYRLNGRPTFLFGSDTYANVYRSACENPWTWHLDHVAARDMGFNVYENLQFCNPPTYEYTPAQWRQFEAMAQSCQREGLVFMPCQLCGHNVAIGDPALERQAAECTAYAQHLGQVPGLLYYLNGDFAFRVEDKPALKVLWNQWLATRYSGKQALAASWGDEVYGDWGNLDYPPPSTGRWDSVREVDHARFNVWLTSRWVDRMTAGVRKADTQHPITSEYYQRPHGGIDLPLTLGAQDASNFGYFDLPYRDEEFLPLALRLNDLRLRGKSVGLGEYGVKTHPAWALENGARGYHILRTEQEQDRLFLAVAHYGFAMGACKVQNWCLRDASENVFPWGVFYPNGRLPKDVATVHRNLSLVWRHFEPRYTTPQVAVLLPDGLRLGAQSGLGMEVGYNAFRALLGLHQQFGVINEQHVAALTHDTQVLIWPSPLCPEDPCYQKVLQWVREGGRLLVTGDLSRNGDRQPTRRARLEELCGARFVEQLTTPPFRNAAKVQAVTDGATTLELSPCQRVQPTTGQVRLATPDGTPILIENRVGLGTVTFCTDAIETGAADQAIPLLTWLYAKALAPVPSTATQPRLTSDLHLCRQPLASGGEFSVVYNTNLPPGAVTAAIPAGPFTVQARVAARYPGLAVSSGEGKLVAVGASGEAAVDGKPLLQGEAQVICLALDRENLAESSAVLLCPFTTGRTQLQSARQWRSPVTVVGDIQDGKRRTFEVRRGLSSVQLDEDLRTCLLLICEETEVGRWTKALEDVLRYPDRIKGM